MVVVAGLAIVGSGIAWYKGYVKGKKVEKINMSSLTTADNPAQQERLV